MKTYELTVFFALISGAMVAHVFLIHTKQPVDWVNKNADELASRFCKGVVKNYCALNVKEV